MNHTQREYENMANGILATFEYERAAINEWVKPAYYVEFNEAKDKAKFFVHYTNEDGKNDSDYFTITNKDSMTKLISYIEDNYNALMQIEPNN
jgi:hypothetical protein